MIDKDNKVVDPQSRKWLVTINNPSIKGHTPESIKDTMSKSKNILYWCMSDEIGGKENTYHTHLFLYFSSAVRRSTLKRRFEGGHFDICAGSAQSNVDYVFKQGKWKGTDKEETNLEHTHYEFGEIPIERQGHRSDLDDLYDMLRAGMTNFEIITENPSYMLQLDKMDKVRQTLLKEKYKNVYRMMDVTYVYGPTRIGKTSGVVDLHGYDKVYMVDDYRHPFDDYEGQDIILFDEFRSSIPLSLMLKYLDGHPVNLACRYNNKAACFTKVYVVSNITIQKQYVTEQREEWESYKAFLARFNRVWEYTKDGIIEKEVKADEWQPARYTPFTIAK